MANQSIEVELKVISIAFGVEVSSQVCVLARIESSILS